MEAIKYSTKELLIDETYMPEKSGIYFFYFLPDKDTFTFNTLKNISCLYSPFEGILKPYLDKITIQSGEMLNEKNQSEVNKMLNHSKNKDTFLKVLGLNPVILYIGRSDNLKKRINQHLNGPLMENIKKCGFDERDIKISWWIMKSELAKTLEFTLQSLIRPGLIKKRG